MRISDVITESYDLDLLEKKFLEGQELTESELNALMEGPRWDAVKRVAKKVPGALGKGVGALGTAAGAVAAVPQGVGRAAVKGYKKSVKGIGGDAAPSAVPAPAPATPTAPTGTGTGVGAFAQSLSGMSEADRVVAVSQILKTFTPRQMKAIRKMMKK